MSDPGSLHREDARWGRGRTILFYISLALNLLIIGAVLGAVGFGGRLEPRASFDGPFPMLRALSEDQRRDFIKAANLNGEKRPERRIASLRRSRELLRLVKAETFDAQRFDALLAEQTRVASSRAETGRVALIAVLTQMSWTERQAYAARLEEALRRQVRDRRPPKPAPDTPR